VGEAFSSAGLAVTATYDDASTKTVTGWSLSWTGGELKDGNIAVTAEAGSKTVTVTYEEKTASFTITVTPVNTDDVTPPAKVIGLTGTAGDGQVTLTWINPTDTDLDHIEITWEPGSGSASVTKGTGTYTAAGLTNGTAYTFTVKAVDASGNKSDGVNSEALTPANTTPPGKVTGLVATPGNGKVRLTWADPADVDLATIEIAWTPGDGSASVTKGTGIYIAESLPNDIDYTFTVTAKDTAGNLSVGEPVTRTPNGSSSDLTRPGPVTSLAVQATATTVTLTWTDPADTDLASIEITWTPPDGTDDGSKSITDGTGTYTTTGLNKGTAYTFSVVAVDASGNESRNAATVSATPREPTAQVTVSFTGPADKTITLTGVGGTLSQAANTALTVTVTVTGAYSVYRWALDGSIISGETGNFLTGYAGSLEVKRHTLTVYVKKGVVEYAKRVTFTVTN
jgi:predicted phage tail protein